MVVSSSKTERFLLERTFSSSLEQSGAECCKERQVFPVFNRETLTGTDKHPERSLCCAQFPAEDGLPWKSVMPM